MVFIGCYLDFLDIQGFGVISYPLIKLIKYLIFYLNIYI